MNSAQPERACRAFTRIQLLAVIVCIVLLAAVLLPALARAKVVANRAWCNNFLKQIGWANRTWAADHNDKFPSEVSTNGQGSKEWLEDGNVYRHFQLIFSVEKMTPFILGCPADTRKSAKNLDSLQNRNVSYFVGLGADEMMPSMPVCGDRNLVTNDIAVGAGVMVIREGEPISWSGGFHGGFNNVGLADGSVATVDSAGLQQLFERSGTNLNRLAIP
jgi:competence protein ComGC